MKMIPIFESIKIGETKTPDGRTVPIIGQGKRIDTIHTADELGKLFVLHVLAEVEFAHKKRPDLAKRAFTKAHLYSNQAVFSRWEENRIGESAPSPKLAEFIFQKSHSLAVRTFEENFNTAIVSQ